MEEMIEKLLKADEILVMYTTNDRKLLLVENKNGGVFSINEYKAGPHHIGYQYSVPIKPNLITGSSLIGTGDMYAYTTLEEMVQIATTNNGKSVPNFLSPKERGTVQFLTAEQRASEAGSIWVTKLK